jgi:hypothetical protein
MVLVQHTIGLWRQLNRQIIKETPFISQLKATKCDRGKAIGIFTYSALFYYYLFCGLFTLVALYCHNEV